MKKAKHAKDAVRFEEIPNVGERMAGDFKQLGIKTLAGLKSKDPFKLYQKICMLTKSRQDPCVLDTYMAAVDFMNGGKVQPWWNFTASRKKKYPNI